MSVISLHEAPGHATTFRETMEVHRGELLLHCYRMLGSFQEAEDLVQETLLRAWRGQASFRGGSPRGWLYKIATNVCLNALVRRKRRILPEAVGSANPLELPDRPAMEISWLDPFPDAAMEAFADTAPGPEALVEHRESLRLAFVAAIQYLTPRQRAALLLCDVLGWSALEVSELLETSTASINSALQRARATLRKRQISPRTNQSGLSDFPQGLVERYMKAWESMDVDHLALLLREDAILSMPPWSQWFSGRDAICTFFIGAWQSNNYSAFRLLPTAANGQVSFAAYSRASNGSTFQAHSLHVLSLDEGTIARLTLFLDPALFTSFHFPQTL